MSPWDSFLEFVNKLVSPDWGALVALIPLAVAVLVVGYLGWIARRALTAPPTRTRALPAAPMPANVHMPGPSIAPFLAAAGFACFFLALLFVHVGPRLDPATRQPIADSTSWTIAPIGLLAIAIGLVALICFGVCLAATRIEKTLGASGALVLAKLLGVLLSALAVQYVIDGARAVLTG